MIIERLTGNNVPEATLRTTSEGTEHGFHQNSERWGISARGIVELLNSQPGIQATFVPDMTLTEMQAAIQNGRQVTIAYESPYGGHQVVVNHIETFADGHSVLTVDDPSNGTQRQHTDGWWSRNGRPGLTIVATRTPNR